MDSYQQRLQRICKENESKWKILTDLSVQIESISRGSTTAAAADQQQQDDIADAKRDPKETFRASLQVELDLLQSHRWTASAASLPQGVQREIVSSYDELRETHSVLLQQLARDTQRLERLNDTHQQHQSLNERLTSMSSADIRSNPQKDAVEPAEDDEKKQNEWIRRELKYAVAQMAEEWSKAERKQPASRKRRRQKSEGADLFTLDLLVLELLRLQQTSPIDPYLRVDTLSVKSTDIAFLRRAGVIEVHPEDEHLIRLSNYND